MMNNFKNKPREKLISLGVKALSNQELLAVLLGKGNKKESVFELSERIMKDYGGKILAKTTDFPDLINDFKLSKVPACQIAACFELGRRFFLNNGDKYLRCAEDVFNYLKDIQGLRKEQLRGLYLNSRNMIIHDEIVALGNLTTNIIHPREIFQPAIEYSAAAIIIAHNHPSGKPSPSQEDLQVTNELMKASQILKIPILDHIIIGRNSFYSFKEMLAL